jgi:hypothetical protein
LIEENRVNPLIPFAVFGLVFVVLAVWLVKRNLAGGDRRRAALEALGFDSAPQDRSELQRRVTALEDNPDFEYQIQEPFRRDVGKGRAWFYVKERHSHGWIVQSHEFLVPLSRPSKGGLLLFFKPSAFAAHTTATDIAHIGTSGWAERPRNLVPLDLPADATPGNLIGALGPQGRRIGQLIQPAALAALELVGDYGICTVLCRDGWCALSSGSTRIALDHQELWSVVRKLSNSTPA